MPKARHFMRGNIARFFQRLCGAYPKAFIFPKLVGADIGAKNNLYL
jgi:hypothetical protein